MTIDTVSFSGLFYPQDPAHFAEAVAPRSVATRAATTLPSALLLPHASWQYILDPVHHGLGTIAHLEPKQILLLAPLHSSTETAAELILPASNSVTIGAHAYPFSFALRDALASHFSVPCSDAEFIEESSWQLLLPLIASYYPTATVLPILSGSLNAKQVRSYALVIKEVVQREPATLIIVTANANAPLSSPLAEEEAAATLAFLTEERGVPLHSCNASALRALSQQPWYSHKKWNILGMHVAGEAYTTLELDERNAHVWQLTAVLE